jgi:hypothetical protein
MVSNKLSLSNWNYSYYNSENFKALISVAAMPSEIETDQVSYLYCPTVIDENNVEVFQKEFSSLLEAISFINERYSHWQFMNPTESSSGCNSCTAH